MKNFLIRLVLVASPFILLLGYPMYLYKSGAFYGDAHTLGGYSYDPDYYNIFIYDPHFEKEPVVTDDYQSCATDSSVLILGDSFSMQGKRGFLAYLQDEMEGWDIFHVQTATESVNWYYLQRSLMDGEGKMLLFSRMPDFIVYMLEHAKKLPNTIVMESNECLLVERMLQTRFHVTDDSLSYFVDGGEIHRARKQNDEPYHLTFNNNPIREMEEDMDQAQLWVKQRCNINFNQNAWKMELDRECFTCKGDERNSYYSKMSFYQYTPEQLSHVVAVQKRLIQMAEERGVNLIFFITPDKMQLYRKYATSIDERCNNRCLTDDLDSLDSDVHFQLNKKSLQRAIDNGEKDIYFCNDVHWTYKAAEITAKELKQRILRINAINNSNK